MARRPNSGAAGPRRVLGRRRVIAAALAASVLFISQDQGAMAVEEPRYRIVSEDGAFSVRDYAPRIAASVTVDGDRRAAANRGFRMLAGFIFGDNRPGGEIAMTAPVTAERGTKIAMTAPVTTERQPAGQDRDGRWTITFIMPAEWTMQTLPRPTDAAIRIEALPAERVAAVTFSGFVTQRALDRKEAELRRHMDRSGLRPAGPPRYAFYDPPWTLPFLKRNEVMIPVR